MRRNFLIVLGVLVGLFVTTPTISTAAESFKEVFITNDADHAVPTVVQGTAQVAGSVNVTQTPADREPYQEYVLIDQTPCAQTFPANRCLALFPQVPTGKRLVITYASARYGLTTTSTGKEAHVRLGVALGPEIHLPAPADTGSGVRLAAGPVSFYADAGEWPVITVVGEFLDTLFTGEASIVGYLVPA